MDFGIGLGQRILLGFVAALIIGLAGYLKKALSFSGMLGAVVVGAVTFGFGGWPWAMAVVAFFVSSSALTLFGTRAKAALSGQFEKMGRRDSGQVMANGGMASVLAVVYFFSPPAWRGAILAAFAGAISTVNADTWATEIGVFSRRNPRLLTTWRKVPAGTSGAVSGLGLITAAAGAFFAAVVVSLSVWSSGTGGANGIRLLVAGSTGGFIGALFDSLLGATAQAIYYCPGCRNETEKRQHTCGASTTLVRGWAWLGNDLVNLFSSAAGGVISLLIFELFGAGR